MNVVDGARPVRPESVDTATLKELRFAAARAIDDGAVVRSSEFVVVPDVVVLEWVANGARVPETASLGWPNSKDPALRGRTCILFRVKAAKS